MESTRPIRALTRGLDALTVLNSRDGATVSEVAQEVRLPRTTVYRILETLCDGGFAFRDTADDRYRLSIMVRGLSGGFEDEAWIARLAKPSIEALCADVVWPVSLATLSGIRMMVRETTDHATPLAVERQSAGFHSPLLTGSAGRVYLAFCPPGEREALLERLARSNQEDDKPARVQRAELERNFADVAAQGFATAVRTRRLAEEISISVPVELRDRAAAVLTLRFLSSALSLQSALERFLPKMRECAARISTSFSEQHAPERAVSAPDAA
jgi:IclR family mhp operon transcriptional activator